MSKLKRGSKLRITAGNLPPSLSWIHTTWLMVLTFAYNDMHPAWYGFAAAYAIIMCIGTVAQIYEANFVDVFKGINDEDHS